jgi:hypothetical protein
MTHMPSSWVPDSWVCNFSSGSGISGIFNPRRNGKNMAVVLDFAKRERRPHEAMRLSS